MSATTSDTSISDPSIAEANNNNPEGLAKIRTLLEANMEKGAAAFTAKKYIEAVTFYTAVIQSIAMTETEQTMFSFASRALSNRSASYLLMNMPKEALDDARECVEFRPSWVRAHLRVAAAAEKLEQFDLAISALEAAMKAEDQSGAAVPSKEELESRIIALKQKQNHGNSNNNNNNTSGNNSTRTSSASAAAASSSSSVAHDDNENVVASTSAAAESWMQTIRKNTHQFDNILNNKITSVSSKNIITFFEYLKEYGFNKQFDLLELAQTQEKRFLFFPSSKQNSNIAREALCWISKFITESSAAHAFCSMIADVTFRCQQNQHEFGLSEVVYQSLFAVSKYCQSSDSAESFCRAIQCLIKDNEETKTFLSNNYLPSLSQCLIAVSKSCTNNDSVYCFCELVVDIVSGNEANKKFFKNNKKMFAVLSFLSSSISTPSQAEKMLVKASQALFVDDDNNNIDNISASSKSTTTSKENIAVLKNNKLVELLESKKLNPLVCRHIESKGHNGQEFVKPEYVIETFPSVEFLKTIKLIRAQIRSLVSIRTELGVQTTTVPYLEADINVDSTTLTAEEAEKLLQEAAPLFTTSKYSEAIDVYSQVVDGISLNEADASLKQILSRALSNRSGCFLGLKKAKEALQDGRKCVDVRPSWVRSHLRVAVAATELEQFDLAISSYESAIKAKDRSGAAVPSKIELESKILGISWLKKKPKVPQQCFLSKVLVAQEVSESDAKKLFSFFDKPFTQFFDLTESDIIAILGYDLQQPQQQQKLHTLLHAKSGCEHFEFNKFVAIEKAKATKQKLHPLVLVSAIQAASHFHAGFISGAKKQLQQRPHDEQLKRAVFMLGQIAIEALLFLIGSITDTAAAGKLTQTLGQMIEFDDNIVKHLCNVQFCDSFIALSKYIIINGNLAMMYCRVISQVVENTSPPDHQMYLTEAVRDSMINVVEKNGNNEDSITILCGCIASCVEGNQALYSDSVVINCLFSLVKRSGSPQSLWSILDVIQKLADVTNNHNNQSIPSEIFDENGKVAAKLSKNVELKQLICKTIPEKLKRFPNRNYSPVDFTPENVKEAIDRISKLLSWK